MHRYSRTEYERRFLVHALPAGTPWAVRRLVDRYVDGTRIRLRHSEGIVDGKPESIRKLTQKIPHAGGRVGHQGELTTMYVDDNEYAVLAALPAAVVVKTRYSFPPMGVDVFEGHLAGLLIAEMEFDSEEDMARFQPPDYCTREISTDPRFTGGCLVRLRPHEVHELLRNAAYPS